MNDLKQIKSALISVYHKDGLKEIVELINKYGIKLYSTGGTEDFIKGLGIEVNSVESLTTYPSILGGRVKTLHPKVFGGILNRRENANDKTDIEKYDIPEIDLVIVDLYPFEETVKSGESHENIIEKIDIGGISLIRAAAKNYKDVLIVSSMKQYSSLLELLRNNDAKTSIEDRKSFAKDAFSISSHYDTAIFNYFDGENNSAFKTSILERNELRYGENPHQKGLFFGNFNEVFDKLHGKEISYNNLLDIDSAVNLISEFSETTFAILKHNNACGVASREKLVDAWVNALAGDPVSAFGGILVTNAKLDIETATEINELFYEVIIAPAYDEDAFELLKQKKNRIILLYKKPKMPKDQFRSLLNGVLWQEKDLSSESKAEMKLVTKQKPSEQELDDLEFALKIVKHSKSNTIVLAKKKRLSASGIGQTSRVDALRQAITKANGFGFDLNGAVMASDAFFPFADSVEIAQDAGITAVVQPGGSVKDHESIDFCDKNNMSMMFTGVRHFKH